MRAEWRDLMIDDLAAGEAEWEDRAIHALAEAESYREVARAALEKLHVVTRQLARERQMRLELADELRRYTARQVAERAA